MPLLYTVSHAAHMLSLTPREIRESVYDGQLRAGFVRGKLMLHRDELIAFANPLAPRGTAAR